jgi:hypothetical protein
MPNAFKYNLSNQTLALKKAFFYIGVGDVGKGPTDSTGYYNGITPPSGGYTIYINKASGGPVIYVANNDSELISLTNKIAGTSYVTVSDCLLYFRSQNDRLVTNIDYPTILTSGLQLNYDPAFVSSYPRANTLWYSLSSGVSASLQNSPSFDACSGSGSFFFDGTNDTTSSLGGVSSGAFTLSIWVNTQISSNGTYSIIAGSGSVNSVALVYTNGSLTIQIGTSAGVSSPINVSGLNAWTNYTITRDAANGVTVYTNNSSNGSTSRSGVFEVRALAKSSTSLYYRGNIGNILFYNTILTTDQITQNYNALKGRYGL